MRAIIQRVRGASVSIDDQLHASIHHGLLIFLGIETDDEQEDVDYLVRKIAHLRIFSDDEGKMNLDMTAVHAECLVVSQFTLFASTKKGNRPSFTRSAKPEIAIPLYEMFINQLSKAIGKEVQTGVFGADMQVELMNDGPVTIFIDSKVKE